MPVNTSGYTLIVGPDVNGQFQSVPNGATYSLPAPAPGTPQTPVLALLDGTGKLPAAEVPDLSGTYARKSPFSPRGNATIAWLGDSLTSNGLGSGFAGGGYVGYLASGSAAGAVSISLGYNYTIAAGYGSTSPPAIGGAYVIDEGTATEEWFVPSAVTGAASPYTATVPALTYAHAANATVRADGRTFNAQHVPLLVTALSGNQLRYGGVYAHGSYTTQQIHDIYLPMILARKYLPAAVVVCAGVNDNFALTAMVPMLDMLDQLAKAGVLPIAVSVPPPGSAAPTGSDVNNRMQWNARLHAECVRRGIPFVDVFTPLINPATGGMAATYATDNTHPGVQGAAVWAQTLYTALKGIFPSFISSTPGATYNNTQNAPTAFPFNNGNAIFSTSAGGAPTGFNTISASTGDTLTMVTEAGVPGQLQQIARAANATGVSAYGANLGALIAGHRYRAYLWLKTTGVNAAYTAKATTTSGITNSTFQGFSSRMIANNQDPMFSILNWTQDISTPTLFVSEFVLPAGVGSWTWDIELNGDASTPAYSVEWRPWLEDLTVMGYTP